MRVHRREDKESSRSNHPQRCSGSYHSTHANVVFATPVDVWAARDRVRSLRVLKAQEAVEGRFLDQTFGRGRKGEADRVCKCTHELRRGG